MKRKLSVGFLVTILVVMVACTAAWVNTALQDLPTVIQVASGIAGLVSTVQGGSTGTDAEIVANISKEAAADLQLVQTAYNNYKSNPNSTTLQAIQDAIGTVNSSLPQLLAAAHIKNSKLEAEVEKSVELVLNTVNAFAALVPAPPAKATAERMKAHGPVKVPKPDDIKQQWYQISGQQL